MIDGTCDIKTIARFFTFFLRANIVTHAETEKESYYSVDRRFKVKKKNGKEDIN